MLVLPVPETVLGVRVLVACEKSGIVRDAFLDHGHDAWSCDILPSEAFEERHLQGDVRDFIEGRGWQLLIAHPPCQFLSVSGYHWVYKRPGRLAQVETALSFFRAMLKAPIPRICVENPIGITSSRIARPTQIIQPYEFGEDASKKTGLWLKGLPLLQPTRRIPGRMVMWKGKPRERWANQTDSGQNRLGPSPTRAADRARTYRGVACAMADQWGSL
jgi:hypothetical protein